jgi:hypothetical protein
MAQKPKTPVKLNVRLEAHLHELLTKAAEGSNRSLQTEIISRLEQSFNPAVPDHVQNLIDKAAVTAVAETLRVVGWPETELAAASPDRDPGQEHDREGGAEYTTHSRVGFFRAAPTGAGKRRQKG